MLLVQATTADRPDQRHRGIASERRQRACSSDELAEHPDHFQASAGAYGAARRALSRLALNPVSTKVSAGALTGFGLTVIFLAIHQYAPAYAPNADLAAAITTFLSALAGLITPHENSLVRRP